MYTESLQNEIFNNRFYYKVVFGTGIASGAVSYDKVVCTLNSFCL